MAIGYHERERAFIEGLKENTGRDLDEWMQAISAQGLPHRNDIIDWLRHQGLMFSKASWLERIHHNGGRAIYADAPSGVPQQRPRRRDRPADGASPPAAATSSAPADAASQPASVQPATSPPEPAAAGDMDALLARAKAYRPLAQHVLARIKTLRPQAIFTPRDGAVLIADPQTFAALGISAKELRLHLALGNHPFDDNVKKGQAGGGLGKSEALSHMLVLTDARQVDERLNELITRAASGMSGG